MKLRPRSDASLDRALTVLREAHAAFYNVRGASHQPAELYNAYVRTATTQTAMLASVFPVEDVDRMVTTAAHIRLMTMDQGVKLPLLAHLVNAELDDRVRLLEQAIKELTDDMEFYSRADLVVVPDTNSLLHHPHSVARIPWGVLAPTASRVLVAIPILVVDEIDDAKLSAGNKIAWGDEKLRVRAQRTIRQLEEWFTDFSAGHASHQMPGTSPLIEFAVVLDDPDRERLPKNDSEIIDQARAMGVVARGRLTLVAYDLGMRLRARAAGVLAVPPPGLPDDDGDDSPVSPAP